MERFLASILSPENMQSVIVVMLALFAKDFVSGILHRLAKRLLSDKDPKNDVLGELAEQAAVSIDKIKGPGK